MNSSKLRPGVLAFIYDHLADFAVWIRQLTPAQIENIADVLIAYDATSNTSSEIVPLAEIEKREIRRAVTLCNGDFNVAARALRIGRTTLYRKMREWGYSATNRMVIHQASVLAALMPPTQSAQQNGFRTAGSSDKSNELNEAGDIARRPAR